MLSLFKKKPTPDQAPTLKTRVESFWKWYAVVGPRFYETIESKKCADLAGEVSAKVDELLPGFAWVFGPGANKQGHSFTLSGEGVIHHQLITLYWLSRAPSLPGCTFYASRQPGSIKGQTIKMGEQVFDPVEFWITPVIDDDLEKIDITAWHPMFESLKEQQRQTILYLFLDELFGEYGTDQFIGRIELGDRRLADAIPLAELLDFVNKIKAERGWKKYPPGECFSSYECKEPHDRFPRGDVFVGTTANFRLIRDYLNAEGELENPLKNTEADYVFVSFENAILPKGGESAARGVIEDALDVALKSAFSGQVLGGAYGTSNAYIDLMIFDGVNSLEIIKNVLREKQLPPGTEIHFFAKEKRGHRIVI
jgi:hypothetical protein